VNSFGKRGAVFEIKVKAKGFSFLVTSFQPDRPLRAGVGQARGHKTNGLSDPSVAHLIERARVFTLACSDGGDEVAADAHPACALRNGWFEPVWPSPACPGAPVFKQRRVAIFWDEDVAAACKSGSVVSSTTARANCKALSLFLRQGTCGGSTTVAASNGIACQPRVPVMPQPRRL